MSALFSKLKNQTPFLGLWFSSCMFRLAAVLIAILFAGYERSFAQEQKVAREVMLPVGSETWSSREWSLALEQTYKSLTNAPIDPAQSQLLNPVDASDRQAVFNRWVGEVLASEAYGKAQEQAWLRDHFEIDGSDPKGLVRCERGGWDTQIYRDWLARSFRENLRFDRLVQCQLTGAGDAATQLATHAWYLAGHRTVYEILDRPTPIESNLIHQFQSALASIQRTESMDWQRLLNQSQQQTNPIKRWWQSQSGWPKIPAEELVWGWPTEVPMESPTGLLSMVSPVGLGAEVSATVDQAPVMRGFREWTLVIAGRFSRELLDSPTPVGLMVQSEDGLATEDPQRSLVIELGQGRLTVRMIHDSFVSKREIQAQETVPVDRSIQIAIVNDGLGRSDSVRILLDGQPCKTKSSQVADNFYKEIFPSKPIRWRFAGGKSGLWQLEQVQFYRLALSVPECKGLVDGVWQQDWEEMDQEVRSEWVEHYARRVDTQWRYQRESRSHYVANLAAVLESQSMLPMLASIDQPIELVHPARFPVSLIPEFSESLWESIAETRACDWTVPGKYLSAESLARGEVKRTWRSMLRFLGGQVRDQKIPESLFERFMNDFDRSKMVLGLVEHLLSQIAE